jgi:hypothetical protein
MYIQLGEYIIYGSPRFFRWSEKALQNPDPINADAN